MGSKEKKLKNLWKRYVLALSLIAIFISVTFIISEIKVMHGVENATTINIAGRQRMLSQRIALYANLYYSQVLMGDDTTHAEKMLNDAASLFMSSHKALTVGDEDIGLYGLAGEIAHEIYFTLPDNLDVKVDKYVELAGILQSVNDVNIKKETLDKINELAEEALLDPLDRVVGLVEDYDQSSIKGLIAWERATFIMALVVLLLEALLIFFPIHKFILQAIKDQRTIVDDKIFRDLILRNIPDFVFVKNADFEIIDANPAFLNIFSDKVQKTILGKTSYDLYGDELGDIHKKQDEQVLRKGFLQTTEDITLPNGDVRKFHVQKMRFDNVDKESFILCVARDVTELKEIKEIKDKLSLGLDQQAKSQAKLQEIQSKNILDTHGGSQKTVNLGNNFVDYISHGLRTPLTTIVGLAQQDRSVTDDKKRKRNVEIIHQSSQELLQKINDLSDLSRIEDGSFSIDKVPFDPKHIFINIDLVCQALCDDKNIKVVHNFDDLEDIFLIGDAARLERVMLNLCSNAIRYTDKGTVSINVSYSRVSNNNLHMTFTVEDTGKGIPQEKLDTVFDKFTQIDESMHSEYSGVGLGLYVSKYIVNLMGGSIKAESGMGLGSTFKMKVHLDRYQGDMNDEGLSIDEAQDGLKHIRDAKIVIAEDNEFNRDVLVALVESLGCKSIYLAANGEEAFVYVKKNKVDIVLMDCYMPEVDGFYSASKIRREEASAGQRHRVPIMATTVDVSEGIQDKCIAAGMDDYIAKPIDVQSFRSKLSRWFILD